MLKFLLIALSAFLLIPNFIDKSINETAQFSPKEKFDPKLSEINSIDKLENYTDSVATSKNISVQSINYFVLLESIISDRFYHGFSEYTLKENWVAALSQKMIGYGLDNKVQPNDIMKNQMAACSQQAAVMMAIAKRKKVDYRPVGFPHHYAMEIKEKENWYFFDANMEPSINTTQRLHQSWNAQNDSLKKYYSTSLHTNLGYQFGNKKTANFGSVNDNPAPRLKLFHYITFLLSKLLWCMPLILVFVKKRNNVKAGITAKPHLINGAELYPSFTA